MACTVPSVRKVRKRKYKLLGISKVGSTSVTYAKLGFHIVIVGFNLEKSLRYFKLICERETVQSTASILAVNLE